MSSGFLWLIARSRGLACARLRENAVEFIRYLNGGVMTSNRIGCAGWSLASKDSANFPVDGAHLERYADVFNAVEINSSFYKQHQAKTYQRWAASVPDDFRFSVKLPRTVTQYKRLVGAEEEVLRFAGEAGALGDKLGCVLVQLPPSLHFDAGVAETFFADLQTAFNCAIACEARHASWFAGDATALLRGHAITRVIADPPAGQPGPHEPTAKMIYARLHGSPRIYYSRSEEHTSELQSHHDI